MQRGRRKFTEWLAILPEKEYLRIVYIGKLQIPSSGSTGCRKDLSAIELEEMMNEIWKLSCIQNQAHNISGHLSYTNDNHVCQWIEGKFEDVRSLMANIRNDPRIIISKEFSKSLSILKHEWYIAMWFSVQWQVKMFGSQKTRLQPQRKCSITWKIHTRFVLREGESPSFTRRVQICFYGSTYQSIAKWSSNVHYIQINTIYLPIPRALIKNKSWKLNFHALNFSHLPSLITTSPSQLFPDSYLAHIYNSLHRAWYHKETCTSGTLWKSKPTYS